MLIDISDISYFKTNFNLLKHDEMIHYKQLLLEGYEVKIALGNTYSLSRYLYGQLSAY